MPSRFVVASTRFVVASKSWATLSFPITALLRLTLRVKKVGSLPERKNLIHYHSFVVREEIEKAFGLWRQDDDYWQVESSAIDEPLFDGSVFQDHYRRLVVGCTATDLHEVTVGLDAVIHASLEAANVYILTLGLIDVWRNKRSGPISRMNPSYGGGGGGAETEFVNSSFSENYEYIRRAIEMLSEHFALAPCCQDRLAGVAGRHLYRRRRIPCNHGE